MKRQTGMIRKWDYWEQGLMCIQKWSYGSINPYHAPYWKPRAKSQSTIFLKVVYNLKRRECFRKMYYDSSMFSNLVYAGYLVFKRRVGRVTIYKLSDKGKRYVKRNYKDIPSMKLSRWLLKYSSQYEDFAFNNFDRLIIMGLVSKGCDTENIVNLCYRKEL